MHEAINGVHPTREVAVLLDMHGRALHQLAQPTLSPLARAVAHRLDEHVVQSLADLGVHVGREIGHA